MSIFLPPRTTVTVTVSPGFERLSHMFNSDWVVIGFPLIATSTSPPIRNSRMPASTERFPP